MTATPQRMLAHIIHERFSCNRHEYCGLERRKEPVFRV